MGRRRLAWLGAFAVVLGSLACSGDDGGERDAPGARAPVGRLSPPASLVGPWTDLVISTGSSNAEAIALVGSLFFGDFAGGEMIMYDTDTDQPCGATVMLGPRYFAESITVPPDHQHRYDGCVGQERTALALDSVFGASVDFEVMGTTLTLTNPETGSTLTAQKSAGLEGPAMPFS